MEQILTYIECIVTVPVALAVYLYLVASVFPRTVLRLVWRGGGSRELSAGDRGLRRMVFPGGRAVLYRPSPKACRYLRQYALIRREGCTYVKCRIHPDIAHIRYDVATFDRRGRLLDVLSVSERVAERGYTRTVRLPRDTAYACVTLRKADGVYTSREVTLGYSYLSMGIYAALCAAVSVAVGLVLQGCLAGACYFLPGFGEARSVGGTAVISALLGLLCAAGILLLHYLHSVKGLNK